MRNHHKEYYEQPVFWEKDYMKDPEEKKRIEEIINCIPVDVKSILDVGCGNGTFLNTLTSFFPKRFNALIGMDTSREALKHSRTRKILGNIDNIPFKNNCFDLLTALEVLEHLPQEDFQKGILELQRVSRKYLIITVPNDQNLELLLVRCPKCCCCFNPYFHLRSFNKNYLNGLLSDFKLIEIKELGNTVKSYPTYYTKLQYLLQVWRKVSPPPTAICPQCGFHPKKIAYNSKNNSNFSNFLWNFILLFNRLVKLLIIPKEKRRWLVAIYEKKYRQY